MQKSTYNTALSRSDRADTKQKVMVLYLRKNMAANAKTLTTLKNRITEIVAVQVKQVHNDHYTITIPNITVGTFKTLVRIRSLLHNLATLSTEVIIRDLNFNLIKWP